MNRRIWRWVAPVIIGSLVVFSLSPIRPHATLHGTRGHLALHIVAFGLAAFALLSLTANLTQRWIAVLSLCFLAFAIEKGQVLMFHQYMEWSDVLLDCSGVLMAFLLLYLGQEMSVKA